MLIAIGLVVSAITTAVAVLVPWLPEQASEERAGIDFVFWFTTAICIAIFAIVAAVTVYAAVKFRVRPDDDSDGPPIHGHTGLEIAWTAVPAVLVTAIGIASAVVLGQNDKPRPNPVQVSVLGQQFAWQFRYPEHGKIVSSNLRLPVDRSAVLTMEARDVIHSLWVPEFGQKLDVVPGNVTRLVITPTKRGEYRLMCTELCGLGHALMRTRAIVMSQAGFNRWVRAEGAATAATPQQGDQAVFSDQGCGGCHALDATTRKTGPPLGDLTAAARRAGQPLERFIRQSIVAPDAYIERGYKRNVMPPTYGSLPKDELDALVQYLVRESRG